MTHRVSCPSNADAPADHLLNEMDICVHDMKLPIQELTRQIFAEEAVDYLTGDEVLADRESHLDGVGFVRYGDGGQLEFVPPVDLVGLGHGIFEHLLVSLLAQDGPDVHDLRLAAGPRAGAREEHRQQKQTHRVDHQAAPRASPPASGSARPASGQQRGSVALAAAGSIYVGGVSEAKKKEGRKKKWIYVQCGGMCMIILGAGCQPETSKPHLAPFFLLASAEFLTAPCHGKSSTIKTELPDFLSPRAAEYRSLQPLVRALCADRSHRLSLAGRSGLSGCCPWC